MERRLDVSNMTGGSIQSANRIGVTGTTVRHPELGGDAFGGIVTFHTIQHPGKRKIRETGAPWNRIMTGGAIDAELLLDLEMRDVRELHVNVLSGHRNRGDQATGLREAGILDLFRRMTTAASGRIERCVQSRFYARLGVAGGA